MKPVLIAALISLCAAAGGCVAPVGPVEVTRFHVPQPRLGGGPIAVLPAPGQDGASLEFRSYAAAVAEQLVRVGYHDSTGDGGTVAFVAIDRHVLAPVREGSPVSVGVGGSTGSYGSGVGLGIGVDLSGPPPEQVETRLSVTIRDRPGGEVQWEGRAQFSVSAKSPLASTQLGAAKLAEALFRDFPGVSGETILVK